MLPRGDGPLFVRLYAALRRAILEGVHPVGGRLPSTRALALELGVSRTVALAAFEQLLAEGYVVGRAGSGTFVASPLPDHALATFTPAPGPLAPAGAPRLSAFGRRALATARLRPLPREQALAFDFRYGFAPPEPDSLSAWRRAVGQAALRHGLDYAAPEGEPGLRRALAAHLRRHRGVCCEPDQIVVVAGSQQALDLSARLLLDPGDRVLIEDPHYQGARAVLRAAGARLVPLPVDESGLDLGTPARRRLPARLVYVTPSHQFPTGAVMPLARRLALLDWAARQRAYVLEDDYDSEFRYDGRPIEAVQSLDARGRTLYVGTLSKLLFPAVRIGFVVLPPPLVEAFRAGKWLADRHSPLLEQAAAAEFLESGLYERHLRRMRRRHAARRAALIEAVQAELGSRAEVMGTGAGIHIVLWLRRLPAARLPALLARAAAAGVGLQSIAPYYLAPPARAGVLVGYGALSEARIREGIRRFARLLA